MRSISGHIQQRQEELRELVRPVIAKRLELLVEQLWEYPGLWEEINDRYERGSLRGSYPALLKDLSEVKELRHMFLRIGVMHAVRPLLPAVGPRWRESRGRQAEDLQAEEGRARRVGRPSSRASGSPISSSRSTHGAASPAGSPTSIPASQRRTGRSSTPLSWSTG